MDLQQAAQAALGDRKGAVVALEPDTGKILAMVSRPGFDPNTLGQEWETLISGDNTPGPAVKPGISGGISARLYFQNCDGSGIYTGASQYLAGIFL